MRTSRVEARRALLVGGPVGRFVARHRRNPVIRKLAGACRRFLLCYHNVDYDSRHNGEVFVLRALAPFGPKVVFDVGANVGDWTIAVRRCLPSATIHAFEIAPPTFAALRACTADLGRVHCSDVGLAAAEGTVELRHYAGAPALSTMFDYPHDLPFEVVNARVTTGDRYLEEHAIEHVDFLKLDVEGAENLVLQGFAAAFEAERIDVVQFEYGKVNILTRFLLRDFWDFFQRRGYAVGKIYPDYVDFRDYDLADEDFLGPNYLACRADRTDYLRALAGKRSGAAHSTRPKA